MKRYLLSIPILLAFVLFAPAAHATPVSWDAASGVLQPLQALWGNVVKADHFVATSTTASRFPYASTTALSATSLCLSLDCRSVWPSSGATPGGSSGQLQYNASGAFGGVSTSTLNASSPLTGSFIQIGSGGTLGCQTASGSQPGCLASTDWTTFNNKGSGSVTSIATNNGITGGTISTTGTIGLATINAGLLGAVTNGSVPTSQATSTIYGIGTNGYVLAEVAGIPTWVATSSIQNITLTTVGSSGAATLAGNVLNIPQYSGGSSFGYLFPITDTNFGNAANATSSIVGFTGGILASSTSYIANSSFLSNGFVGIGTTTPTAPLDVGGFGALSPNLMSAEFAVATSVNAASGAEFYNSNTGTSAEFRFAVFDTNKTGYLTVDAPGNNNNASLFGNLRSSSFYLFSNAGSRNLTVGTVDNENLIFGTNNVERARITNNGLFGIGTTSPYALLSIAGNVVVGAATAGGTLGDLFLPKLGTAAGSLLAVDPTGKLISTTTPSGGGGSGTVNTGTTGQLTYYASSGTTVSPSTSISLLASGALSNANGDLLTGVASYVVSTTTANGNFTDVQSAINALPPTGGLIQVRCGTYTLPSGNVGIQPKVSGTIITGDGLCTQFNFDKANTTNAIEPAVDDLTNIVFSNFYIHQTNATFGGIGINASNTPLLLVQNIKIDQTGTSTSDKDTKNETFYQRWENLDLRNNNTCIDIGGNPVNDNMFENIRCGQAVGGKGFAVYLDSSSVNGAQSDTFINFDAEPIGSGVGITGIYANNAVDDLFINPYVEGNAVGWNLTANSQRINFQGGEFVSNTTYTNSGSNNQWLGTDKEGVALNLIQASSTIADVSGNDASVPSLSFIGNNNFAKVAPVINITLANSTDSGTGLLISNPGTGTTTMLNARGTGAGLNIKTSTASTSPLILDAASKGGCIIIKDVAGTGYTQLYTMAGVVSAKVHTGALSSCN